MGRVEGVTTCPLSKILNFELSFANMSLFRLLSWIPVVGRFFTPQNEDEETPEPLPPAKIAIVGGGIGGCSAAYFLRKNGGDALDIHVFNEGVVGGRCAVIDFEGNTYEAGGAVIHTSNKYLVDFREKFGMCYIIDHYIAVTIKFCTCMCTIKSYYHY